MPPCTLPEPPFAVVPEVPVLPAAEAVADREGTGIRHEHVEVSVLIEVDQLQARVRLVGERDRSEGQPP